MGLLAHGTGEPSSPLGLLVAEATKEHPMAAEAPQAYHGYLFRMARRRLGPRRSQDYMVRGRLFGGFAVIARSAKYANSGIMT
jgi:hypothetical protein